MTARSLVWLGVRTPRFAEMAAFYRDVLGLEVLRDTPDDARFRLGDGTEVHTAPRLGTTSGRRTATSTNSSAARELQSAAASFVGTG